MSMSKFYGLHDTEVIPFKLASFLQQEQSMNYVDAEYLKILL